MSADPPTSGGRGHIDPSGRLRMIDVGDKAVTKRRAVAGCRVLLRPDVLRAVAEGTVRKGDVLAVAQVAAVQAAKRTPELIPGCHPVRMSAVEVAFDIVGDGIDVRAEVRGEDRTGFEMEALVACATAALTIYDMVKGSQPDAVVTDVRLVEKSGGRSDRR